MSAAQRDYPRLPQIFTAEGALTDGALLLEGGSFRGIYSAGACDVLMENGIHMKAVAGVSAGVLCGLNVASRQVGRFARICILHRHDSRYTGWKAWLSDGGAVGFRFILHDAAKLIPFDAEKLKERRFVAVATDLTTGKPFYAEYGKTEPFEQAVRASASLAFASRIVDMNGVPMLDGGYSESIPLDWAEKQGYRKRIVVLTQPLDTRKTPVREKKKRMFDAFYRKYPAFLQAVEDVPAKYNALRETLAAQAANGETFVIAPKNEIPLGKMEKDTNKLYLYYLHGRRDAEKALPALKAYLGE